MPTRWNRRVILILVLAAMPLACTNATPTAATVATTAGTSATPTAGTPQPAGTVATQPAGTGKSRAGQSFVISLSSGGTQRTALLHVPTGYSSATAVPLIVNFHGKGETGKDQEALSGMSGLADQAGFLVAYPNGIDGQWNDASGSASAADRQFVRDLVTKLRADYTVDPKRIYAAGMSNGGGMTNRVGCDLADVFAAIAPVEGGYSDWEGCSPSQPISVMAFHGLTDPVVPYKGGPGNDGAAGHSFPPIPDWAAAWAARDSCNANATVTHPNTDVTRQEWTQCARTTSVILYSINHQGHSWPGSKQAGANTSQAIDATAEMWRFFQAHPRP